MQFLSIIFKNILGPNCFLINFNFVFKRRPKETRFLATEEIARVDLLSENTSRIFWAWCQLSDLEPALSQTEGGKFSYSSDCRKYKNFDQSGNFLDDLCTSIFYFLYHTSFTNFPGLKEAIFSSPSRCQ